MSDTVEDHTTQVTAAPDAVTGPEQPAAVPVPLEKTVVVDNVHLTYRVIGGSRRGGAPAPGASVRIPWMRRR